MVRWRLVDQAARKASSVQQLASLNTATVTFMGEIRSPLLHQPANATNYPRFRDAVQGIHAASNLESAKNSRVLVVSNSYLTIEYHWDYSLDFVTQDILIQVARF